jgi:beta-glucosidase/6-phospho-beta-glucosidase/beta-galactosidase
MSIRKGYRRDLMEMKSANFLSDCIDRGDWIAMKSDAWFDEEWIDEFVKYARYLLTKYPRIKGKEVYARYSMLDSYGYSLEELAPHELDRIFANALKGHFKEFCARYRL